MLSILHLMVFFIGAIFAVKFPTVKVKWAVVAINAVLASVLGVVFVHDISTSKCTRTSSIMRDGD